MAFWQNEKRLLWRTISTGAVFCQAVNERLVRAPPPGNYNDFVKALLRGDLDFRGGGTCPDRRKAVRNGAHCARRFSGADSQVRSTKIVEKRRFLLVELYVVYML